MWGLGFGLEKVGLAALRFPKIASLMLAIAILFNLSFLTNVSFDGNVTAVLPQRSEAIQNYNEQKERFRDFSRDIVVIIKSPRLFTASGLEDLRFMQLELAITDGIANALSVFSLPKLNPQTGEFEQVFPETITSDDEAAALLSDLLKARPQANTLVSLQENAALIFVNLEVSLHSTDDREVYESYKGLLKAVEEAAPDDFEILYSGLTPIGLTVIGALISDQLWLTLVGMLLGISIAYAVFRSVIAATLCAVPPALTAICTLGAFAIVGIPINYLNTVLPTLALILAFADTVVMYYKWHWLNSETNAISRDDHIENLREAVVRVGPATALTSITTALAFLSFAYSANEALSDFAYLGVAAVSIAFFSVILGLPLAIWWVSKTGWIKTEAQRNSALSSIGERAFHFGKQRPIAIVSAAVIAIIGLYFVHQAMEPEYKVTDYLPRASQTYKAETLVNDSFGGRSLIFLKVPVGGDGGIQEEENRKRLADIEAALETVFSSEQIASLNSIWREAKTDEAIARISKTLAEASSQNQQGYLARDGGAMLVSVRIPSDQSIVKTLEDLDVIKRAVSGLPYADEITVTGFPVLMATEFTRLIEALRTSLLIAVALGIVIIGIATRSPLLALAAITPNLLPILTIELVLFLRGGMINLSEVIALTIAFGIGIDNAVHVINVYARKKARIPHPMARMKETLTEIGPALAASSLIICVACLVTFISSLPVVPILGQLIIATLFAALISNLLILPANILLLERLSGNLEKEA